MFQQQATHAYQARFHGSKLICEHETLSLRAPGQMFQVLHVPAKSHQIDVVALQKTIHLVASTLDLDIIREHNDVGKQKRKHLDALVSDSSAALNRLKSEKDGSSCGVWTRG